MRLLVPFLAGLLALPAAAQRTPRITPDAGPTAYVGGQWYADGAFAPRDTVWADRGVFVDGPLDGAAVVDLTGTFVVPPFGDAHVHDFTDPEGLAAADRRFVAEGVFYALNPNNRLAEREAVRGLPTTVDVAYANGGVTAPGAHPGPAYEHRALGLPMEAMWGPRADEIRASRLRDGDAYHVVEQVADLEAVWPRILAGGPDVVKVYLHHSEEWAEGRPAQPRGLDPAVAAAVVARAHAAGLRAVAHVETAADVEAALAAGADALMHAPGYSISDQDPATAEGGAFVPSDETLAALAARGVPVVATLVRTLGMLPYVPEAYRPSPEAQAAVRAYHGALYRRMADAGVPLAIGADLGGLSSRDEAAYAVATGGLTPAEALHAWAVTSPRLVVPDRAIGRLAPGYEASLLTLACDPTADFACTGQITRRVKQGHDLDADPEVTEVE